MFLCALCFASVLNSRDFQDEGSLCRTVDTSLKLLLSEVHTLIHTRYMFTSIDITLLFYNKGCIGSDYVIFVR